MTAADMVEKVVSLYQAGNTKAAEKKCLQALKKQADSYDLWHYLGLMYLQGTQYSKAIVALNKAMKIRQDDGNLFNNMGLAHFHKGQPSAAIPFLEKAVELGGDPIFYKHLAFARAKCGEDELAEISFKEFIKRAPGPAGLVEYGSFLLTRSRYEEAEEVLQEAAARVELSDLVNRKLIQRKLVELYVAWLRFDRMYDAFEQVLAVNRNPGSYSSYLFHLNNHPTLSGEELFEFYQRYNREYASPADQRHKFTAAAHPPGRKLRLGYMSADMRAITSVNRFLLPLIESHDLSAVEITLYNIRDNTVWGLGKTKAATNTVEERDETQRRYKQCAERWREVSELSPEALAKQIRRDKIDVLVDLSGHTKGERLRALSLKPAPVMVTWLGFGYTTGLEAMDYFLGDEITTPKGTEHLYSEEVFMCERPPFAFMPPADMPEVGPLPVLENGYITFGSFSRAIRFNPGVLECWAKLMHQVPGSRLVLNTEHFRVERNCQIFTETFEGLGITADRLDLLSTRAPETWNEYLKLDIALDPFPHNAGATTFDALWLGLPVLSLKGDFSIQRFGATILETLELNEWVVNSTEEYILQGAALAGNVDKLAELRGTLRSRLRESVFMDHQGLAREFERAYGEMFRRFQSS